MYLLKQTHTTVTAFFPSFRLTVKVKEHYDLVI